MFHWFFTCLLISPPETPPSSISIPIPSPSYENGRNLMRIGGVCYRFLVSVYTIYVGWMLLYYVISVGLCW